MSNARWKTRRSRYFVNNLSCIACVRRDPLRRKREKRPRSFLFHTAKTSSSAQDCALLNFLVVPRRLFIYRLVRFFLYFIIALWSLSAARAVLRGRSG